jgi:TetR/AcrR family fatty acid metabolism transcriptional regulator
MTGHSGTERKTAGGDKRERILDAAERVFALHGFYNARVAEIAREAGVADGTIYLYFKSKDDLLISLFESRMERLNSQLSVALAEEPTAPAKLRRFNREYARLAQEHPEVAEVLTIELRQSSKFMKEYSNPRVADFLRVIAGIIEAGQRDGTLDDSIPATIAARALFGALDELVLSWVLGRKEKFDIVRAADWLSAMTLRGLERTDSRSNP